MTEKISGIYRIVNTVNGKQYIGSSVDVSDRFHAHRAGLRGGKHHSPILQNAWNKYGEGAFRFELLWKVPPTREQLLYEEQQALNLLRAEYNSYLVAGSPLGAKHKPKTPAQRANLSKHRRRALGRAVLMLQEDGSYRRFDSIVEATESIPGTSRTGIGNVCAGLSRRHAGRWWRYADSADLEVPEERFGSAPRKRIMAASELAVVEFDSVTRAVQAGYSKSCIHACLRGDKEIYRGYRWSYT